ncbi:MAG: hypothetical protein U1B78_07585 [Dehalococcoidia bacterium]|nr:hypothetical protein [Dehalococcoidia bacterium]
MYRRIRRLPRAVCLAVALMGLLPGTLAVSCGSDNGDETVNDSAVATEFENAVEKAQGSGLRPYWLGQQFQIVGSTLQVSSKASFYGPKQPALNITYLVTGGEGGPVNVFTYSKAQGGWELVLEQARRNPDTVIQETAIQSWPAELWLVPTASRPVNAAVFVIDLDDMVVLATAKSASTGVPDEDVNPLIDSEVLRTVLEEHLRPYPE